MPTSLSSPVLHIRIVAFREPSARDPEVLPTHQPVEHILKLFRWHVEHVLRVFPQKDMLVGVRGGIVSIFSAQYVLEQPRKELGLSAGVVRTLTMSIMGIML